jgi:hypothetical protein
MSESKPTTRLRFSDYKFRIVAHERPNLLVKPSPVGSSAAHIEPSLTTHRDISPPRSQHVCRGKTSKEVSRPFIKRAGRQHSSTMRSFISQEIRVQTALHDQYKYRSSIKVLRSPLHPRSSRKQHSLDVSLCQPETPKHMRRPRMKLKVDMSYLGLCTVGTTTEDPVVR